MYPELDPNEHIKRMMEQEVGGAVSLNFDPSEDKALAVRFFLEPVRNEERSKKEGRHCCDDVEYCEIRLPGSRDVIRNVVTDRERTRFSRQYAAFKTSGDQDAVSGTPLREWPLMTASQIEEARYFGVRTVEALSQIPDANLQRLGPGWLSLRKQAKDWLNKAQAGALTARLRAENDELKARMETLEKMLQRQAEQIQSGGVPTGPAGPDPAIARLTAQVEALAAAAAPKPKRKYTRRAKAPEAS